MRNRDASRQFLRHLTSGAAILAAVAGCGGGTDVASTQVATRDLWAGINLEAKGNGATRIKVELNEDGGFGSNVLLTDDERLDASASGITVTLQEDTDDFLDIDYEGTIPLDVGGLEFRISLFRTDGSVISGNTVLLPEPFLVSVPRPGQRYTVGDPMLFLWSPEDPGNEMSLRVSTQCPAPGGGRVINIQTFEVEDTGGHVLDTRDLNATSGAATPGSRCDMQVELRRAREGTLDSRFRGGGYIIARQTREIEGLRLRLL